MDDGFTFDVPIIYPNHVTPKRTLKGKREQEGDMA